MIKKIIPFAWKAKYHIFRNKNKKLKDLGVNISNNYSKRIFIFLAADYGNLGDIAITYAQHKFLKENFQEYQVIEIPISCTLEAIPAVQSSILEGDIVTTVGGGNMGDLYPIIENYRQLVIKSFKKNLFISFPQTVEFKENSKGRKALKKAKKIYGNHPNIYLLARESQSYFYFKRNFSPNKIYEVPDIVMTLKIKKSNVTRKGGLICLRDDKEKKLNKLQQKQLIELLQNEFKSINFRDTHIGGSKLNLRQRIRELFKIWNEFSSAECVITDRLHGMIFCYITNTPALVFLNNNHKIKSSYKWIQNVENIFLIEKYDQNYITELLYRIKKGDIKCNPVLRLKEEYNSFLKNVK